MPSYLSFSSDIILNIAQPKPNPSLACSIIAISHPPHKGHERQQFFRSKVYSNHRKKDNIFFGPRIIL